ncbi:DUF3079 domain-containing protein [Pelomonas sp. CA6]|uniref:DUF3079 domain-containing protein n=1 Tax=Pelomonas sp. CA6 TaxID=2907999 RepID=UPI001F4AF66E|nr:DUF3079 domain-containing protein [Pelomonas sp. CA6]MCH7342311.1 DUF3079 domain-containing protein [Pelomonas sp. CA6]
MAKKFPIQPANPGRICWGCDKYCPADSLQCGNGSIATPHPSELFGEDWMSWGLDARREPEPALPATAPDAVAKPEN